MQYCNVNCGVYNPHLSYMNSPSVIMLISDEISLHLPGKCKVHPCTGKVFLYRKYGLEGKYRFSPTLS